MAVYPLTIVVASGAKCSVEFVVKANGTCPANEFLANDCEAIREKGKDSPQSTARAKFMFLFDQMARYGTLSRKRFKKEMGSLYAFSHEVSNIQIRFPCFRDGTKWVTTHGFRKPGAKKKLGKWPEAQVQRAEELKGEYLLRKQASRQANGKQ
jgi:hypothetical protein